ncbi:hypothetical protein HWV62_1625 [Athelia sp. TMB]|nr:hypothetical protein HWV62_1625 [Athelia sp. TMB]
MFGVLPCVPYDSSVITHMYLDHLLCDTLPTTSHARLIAVLANMTSLEYISLRGHSINMSLPLALIPLRLTKLKTLKIDLHDPEEEVVDLDVEGPPPIYLVTILTTFMPVHLTRLYILFPPHGILYSVILALRNNVIAFPHVEELYWAADEDLDCADALALTRAFPALKVFVLVDTYDPFIIHTLGSEVWPKLHTVQLASDLLFEARQLVGARIRAGVPLEYVRLEGEEVKSENNSRPGAIPEIESLLEASGGKEENGVNETPSVHAADVVAWMRKHVEVEFVPFVQSLQDI